MMQKKPSMLARVRDAVSGKPQLDGARLELVKSLHAKTLTGIDAIAKAVKAGEKAPTKEAEKALEDAVKARCKEQLRALVAELLYGDSEAVSDDGAAYLESAEREWDDFIKKALPEPEKKTEVGTVSVKELREEFAKALAGVTMPENQRREVMNRFAERAAAGMQAERAGGSREQLGAALDESLKQVDANIAARAQAAPAKNPAGRETGPDIDR